MKRCLDLVVSSAALLVSLPLLLIVASVLFLLYGRPVIFSQQRVGLNGRAFTLHKFRTMSNDHGRLVTVGGDPRVHRLGKILRHSKLDELPQLWDVLRGKMSLVGPRPEVPSYVEMWPEDARTQILSVRPGITCPASVKFRHESDLLAEQSDPEEFYRRVLIPAKCDLYVAYVEQQSVGRDLALLFETFRAVSGFGDSRSEGAAIESRRSA